MNIPIIPSALVNTGFILSSLLSKQLFTKFYKYNELII
jgi:hypothetical protein